MKKLSFLVVLLSSSYLAMAQQPAGTGRPAGGPPAGGPPAGGQRPALAGPVQPQQGSGRITGTITDAGTKQPVPYATVVLLNPATGKPVDGAAADESGKFAVSKVAAGTYTVQISFLGYKSIDKPGIVITDAGNTVALGTIALASSAQALKEVVVEGQRALVEEKVDRTVYNAEKDETTRGGDATDVLKRVPMLSVDLDGNVSLRGSSNIRVLINNRPSTISANSIADALKQIPADQIKSVEVITSPSAKYDAEGSGGIINIVTKQNNLQGFTLDARGSGGLRSADFGLNGSYRTGKMGFSLGGGGRAQYNTPGRFSNVQNTFDTDGTYLAQATQTAKTRNNNLFGRYSLGWDYDINKYNFLSASVQLGVRNGTNYQDNLLSESYRLDSLGNYPLSRRDVRNARTLDESNTLDLNLNYTRTFETPQQEFSILALYSRNNRTNNYTNDILESLDQNSSSQLRNQNDSYNQEMTLQFDYQMPVGKNQMVEVGAKDIMRQVNSEYATFADGVQTIGTNLSNTFTYDQNVAAGYASYTLGFLKNYTVKAGARYEYTTIEANFQASDTDVDIPSYGVLVPSVNLSRKFASGNTLKAGYNRRIQRPSLQFLNPNRQAANPLNITQGNPELDPEYTNNFELGYNTFIKKTSLNFSLFARNTTGSIQAVRTSSLDTIKTTFDNIGQENAYGGSVFANVNLNNKLTLGGGFDTYYAVLDNNLSDPIFQAKNQGWVISGRMQGSYAFTKGWGLQFFSFYRGRQVQLQGYQGGFGVYSLGVKKDFNEKKGSIGVGADNFFTPRNNIRTEINSPILAQNSVNVLYRTGFRVNLSYRIGKLTTAPPKRKKSINNDDQKEEGGNDSGGQQGGGRP
ncbi:TonB-dependent receptor domain-containing protein [Hymenobacter volaticus]|uniref:TonB-dependent receptor n=1 Tax=Hymenobacter volaticus TaxID=2932254 RepID=A0ABY4GAJ8_9BACT|nr:TonB-dependent receptor [Hymenobacter volaticus]UOQ67792.1 TonB-dependent receptor [Hymenobacter volaticus]